MSTGDTTNSSNPSGLSALVHEAGPKVLAAIKHASAATGVDFSYMMQKAEAESGLNAKAKSTTSSATGLYQFIDKTWMNVVKKYGAKCGLGQLASCIDNNGNVANNATKQQILNLRKDPNVSAMMAAEYTSDNKSYMQQQLGSSTQIGPTELGLAHFLGAGGATEFMKSYQSHPLEQASDLFPAAARANHNIFYNSKTGEPRTLAGVYDLFAKKMGGDTSGEATTVANAAAASAPTNAVTSASVKQAAEQTAIDALNSTPDASDTSSGDANADPDTVIHWFGPRITAPLMAAVSADAGTVSTTPASSASPDSAQAIAEATLASMGGGGMPDFSSLKKNLADPAHLMMMSQKASGHNHHWGDKHDNYSTASALKG